MYNIIIHVHVALYISVTYMSLFFGDKQYILYVLYLADSLGGSAVLYCWQYFRFRNPYCVEVYIGGCGGDIMLWQCWLQYRAFPYYL